MAEQHSPAEFLGHISVGTDNSYDLGTASTNRFRNMYLGGTISNGTENQTVADIAQTRRYGFMMGE